MPFSAAVEVTAGRILRPLPTTMAPSSIVWIYSVLALLVSSTLAATVNYNFNITWVTASPDGFARPVIGINGQWPIPVITASVGDRVVVNVQNQLGNATTSLHFHGLYMNGTTHMDGPVGGTQCSIPNGGSFVYDFNVSPETKAMMTSVLNVCRLPNQARIGIIHMRVANIRMVFVEHLSSTTQTLLTKGSMMRNWFSLFPTGTMIRCLVCSRVSSASQILPEQNQFRMLP